MDAKSIHADRAIAAGKPGPGAKEPLSENPRSSGLPIWIKTSNPAHLRELFLLLNDELHARGFECMGDLQTEPLRGKNLLDFYEVWSKEEGARSPESAGMISLYGNGAPELLKLSPAYPGAAEALVSAFGAALERKIASMGNGGKGLDIKVEESHLPKE